jgi:NTE family protein
MKIGLALGSGSSRGWSHIGIIKSLEKIGIRPDIVCGTSIGSLVGASYVSNKLPQLEEWICSLTKFEIAKFYNINPTYNGLVDIERIKSYLNKYVVDENLLIENAKIKYASVATELDTGREIWFKKGDFTEAVLSSISLPGLFKPHLNKNRWLVDGGLVNPVPVSVCRALGTDIVIAVNLNSDIVGKHFKPTSTKSETITTNEDTIKDGNNKSTIFSKYTDSLFSSNTKPIKTPSFFETIAGSINITQDRITKSRMVGDPPDVLLSPKLSQIGLLDFHRAKEAIAEGQACVQRALPELTLLF